MVVQNNLEELDWGYSILLAFGAEAIIPAEISIPTIRSQFAVEEQNNAMMNFELDTIDEKQKAAAARIAH